MIHRFFCGVLLVATALAAQEMQFAVAAIKPTPEDKMGVGISTSDNGRMSMFGVTVHMIAAQAYGVQNFQVSGGPKWASSERWSIDAAGEGDQRMTSEQREQALRHLLEDRFQAKVRVEEDEVSGFELVADAKGHRLKAAATPDKGTGTGYGPGFMNGRNVTLDQFVRVLAIALDKPVVNGSGVEGKFDVYLTWKPDVGENAFGGVKGPEGAGFDRSVFTAVEEELGMKLVAKKVRVPVVKIESVERPGEN